LTLRSLVRTISQIGNLPPAISFSSLSVPLPSTGTASSSGNVTLLRRDLFDARFQILNEQEDSDFEEGAASSSKTARAPGLAYKSADAKSGGEGESDLVKGIYEGGLKTWEASLDLVVGLDLSPKNRHFR
jgi:protein-histidine N-methyltransferase